ncbi:helix-turn-helix domain-containing protein [Streptomyces aurantiacus]|uniref:helix-turn-helix domain-containing protein n=1 Tax=Streptomyces aurantiacus TaxID=47760 RepID=UPI000A7C1D13
MLFRDGARPSARGDDQYGGTMSTRDDDVEEFAALLRHLKARTDRSYGALARRVNMNTSTLHRYCAGDAVPLDFAPVERFATLCGATPAERLELHRLWILAVAARQRPRTPDTPESPPPDESPVSAESAVPDESFAPDTTGDDDPPRAPDAPEPAHTSEAVASEAPANVPGARTPGSPVPDPADELVSDAGPGSGSGFASGGEAGPRPRSAWYRRRITVTVAAVSALLVTLGSLSALSDGRSSDDASEIVGPSPTPTVQATSSERHRPSASPSPDKTGSSPSAGATGKKSKSAGKSGAPSQNTKANGSKSAAVPLTWTANSQAWKLGCGHDYVIRKDPDQVPPPPIPQDAGTWAATQGAVHGHETNVEISVQGRTSTAVVLTALRVRVVGRTAPVPGTVYAMDQGCGGSITPRSFDVDLDKDRPIARSVPGNDTGTPIPAVRMPYRVSAKDPEVLLVNATTETCGCSWYLELDWSSEGRTGTARIDDHGSPFRTSGIKGLPRYWYGSDGAERGWVPVPE